MAGTAHHRRELPGIRGHEWTIFDLVNYYDRLIDQIKAQKIGPGRTPPIVDALLARRENASLLAQVVCQMEDSDNP